MEKSRERTVLIDAPERNTFEVVGASPAAIEYFRKKWQEQYRGTVADEPATVAAERANRIHGT